MKNVSVIGGKKNLTFKNQLIIECYEPIPCNPCEFLCTQKVIQVGSPITNLPVTENENCSGCGVCVAGCPGQAIFLLQDSGVGSTLKVSFPWELFPLPIKGSTVLVVDSEGKQLGEGSVVKINKPRTYNETAVITVEVSRKLAPLVRGIDRGENNLGG